MYLLITLLGLAAWHFPKLGVSFMPMLDEGTTTRSALQIADQVAQLGGTLGTGSSMDKSCTPSILSH